MSQSLWDRLERRLPAIADRAVRSFADTSALYQGTITDSLYRTMAMTIREFGRVLCRMGREGRDPDEQELSLFDERGRERGAEGFPISDMSDAYLFATRHMWAELAALCGGAPPPETVVTLLRCLQRVEHVAFQAHQEEYQSTRGEARESVREAVLALVDGEPASEHADRGGIRLAQSYAVVALRFSAHPTEAVGDTVGRRLAGRRKVRRLSQALLRALPEETLTTLDPEGGLALLPSTPDRATADLRLVRAAVREVAQTVGIEIGAGFAHAKELQAIPAATAQARRLLELGRPGQIAVIDDLLFEYQVHHDGDAVPHLHAIIDSLREEPDLLPTLEQFFASDFNRQHAAAALHVHPNTVDNRLTKVARITGVSPRTARGLMVLGAALNLSPGDHRHPQLSRAPHQGRFPGSLT